MRFTSFNGAIKLNPNKPLYHVACLLAAAAGTTKECYEYYYSQNKQLRNFAHRFWSNEIKIKQLNRIGKAQDIDLLSWYWANI